MLPLYLDWRCREDEKRELKVWVGVDLVVGLEQGLYGAAGCLIVRCATA
jgi:hypothetical protein